MKNKEKFNKALSYIERDGINELVTWLEEDTDFFSAPASTKFHGNFEGGLVEHTLNAVRFGLTIFNYMVTVKPELEYLKESVILCCLFHDVCKVNCYTQEEKWTKNSQGKWTSYLGWSFKDDFPMGHGEKSVYLISKFIKLKDPEAMAIRWHMGTYEVGANIEGLTKWSYIQASDHPLVRIVHAADLLAATLETTIDFKAIASK